MVEAIANWIGDKLVEGLSFKLKPLSKLRHWPPECDFPPPGVKRILPSRRHKVDPNPAHRRRVVRSKHHQSNVRHTEQRNNFHQRSEFLQTRNRRNPNTCIEFPLATEGNGISISDITFIVSSLILNQTDLVKSSRYLRRHLFQYVRSDYASEINVT